MNSKERDYISWEFEELLRNIVRAYFELCKINGSHTVFFETGVKTKDGTEYDVTIQKRGEAE